MIAGKKTGLPGSKIPEMKEKVCDSTTRKAYDFIKGPAKKFKRGY